MTDISVVDVGTEGVVNLAGLDLNLLVPLDVLLEERSVTRAAARLGLSQPALSAALGRLRRHFGDPLLVRSGNTYELSPLARTLRGRASRALDEVERVFTSRAEFDPATSRRTFTVQTSDYAMAVLGSRVARIVAERAPGVRIRFQNHSVVVNGDMSTDWLRAVDGMILPRGFVFDLPSVGLFTDEWVCLTDRGNPEIGDSLTMDDVVRLPWVLTYHDPSRFIAAVRQLQLQGVEPRVEAVVESFLALPFYLAGTSRLTMVQPHLARALATNGALRVLACPWNVVPIAETLWWHPVHTYDHDHVWFRELLGEAAGELAGDPGPSGPRTSAPATS